VIAQAAQAAHENTLGYACHELRNPLHAISASAAFLAERIPPGDEAYEDLQSILTGAGQMHRLVNDVLDLGKLRAGKLTIQPEPFSIRSIICIVLTHDPNLTASWFLVRFSRKLLNEIRALHMAMVSPGVAFTVDVMPTVPHTVLLDPLRIHQLISNGLTNSIKVTCGFRALVVPNPPLIVAAL
jgi:signal transduction histidine kinase